jgi:hypothetical protein
MAGAPTKDTKLLRMNVSIPLYEMLTRLKAVTHWGASENDVALYLLTKQLDAVKDSGVLAEKR